MSNKTDDFDYNLIKIMDKVIIHGSISNAAKNLNVSVPAVSASISKLKQQLGEEIFYRTQNGLKPTQAGVKIHSSFIEAMTIIDDAIGNNKMVEHPLKILCPDMLENYFFKNLISHFPNCGSEVNLSKEKFYSATDITNYLIRKEIDLVIADKKFVNPTITSIKIDLFDDFVVIIGTGNELASDNVITLYNYYSTPHVKYHDSLLGDVDSIFGGNLSIDTPYTGIIKNLYITSSSYGVVNAIENSNALSIIPRKIASYLIKDRNCNLAVRELPESISISSVPIYASFLSQNKKLKKIIDDAN